MGDTLSKMEDMQDRHPSGRPMDAKHTTLVAQDVPSRLERIATQLMVGILSRDSSINAGPTFMSLKAVQYARQLIEVIDGVGDTEATNEQQ